MNADSVKSRSTLRVVILAISLATLLLALDPMTWADAIELKTGERIEGAFKQATTAGAVIEVAGQSITIPIEKLRAIYFGTAPTAKANMPPPQYRAALDALLAIRSVANSGISYRDYSQRILDARVTVDRYLSSPESGDSQMRQALRVAMVEYELAAEGWLATNAVVEHANLWGPMGRIIADPEVQKCPAAKAIVTLRDNPPQPPVARKSKSIAPPARQQDPIEELGLLFAMRGQAPTSIWPCANEKVAEAERSELRH